LKEKEELLMQLQSMKYNTESEAIGVNMSLNDIEYPNYWHKQGANFQCFDVSPYSAEYDKVISQWKKGMPGVAVVRLERNQNKTLWMWYYLRRKMVGSANKADPNEEFLYHGSRNDAYDAILKEGLDIRVANLGGAIGAGVYFATSSATSSGYVSSTAWNGVKKMLYCRVILGKVGPGKHGLRRPPEISKGKLYDSVGNQTMYVIFDNYQSYPEYIIHYK